MVRQVETATARKYTSAQAVEVARRLEAVEPRWGVNHSVWFAESASSVLRHITRPVVSPLFQTDTDLAKSGIATQTGREVGNRHM